MAWWPPQGYWRLQIYWKCIGTGEASHKRSICWLIESATFRYTCANALHTLPMWQSVRITKFLFNSSSLTRTKKKTTFWRVSLKEIVDTNFRETKSHFSPANCLIRKCFRFIKCGAFLSTSYTFRVIAMSTLVELCDKIDFWAPEVRLIESPPPLHWHTFRNDSGSHSP